MHRAVILCILYPIISLVTCYNISDLTSDYGLLGPSENLTILEQDVTENIVELEEGEDAAPIDTGRRKGQKVNRAKVANHGL